jgi:hypothetical protein
MASWTPHLKLRHQTDSRGLSDATREGGSLREYHEWLHTEFSRQADHYHTDDGQLIELGRQGAFDRGSSDAL